MPNTTPLRRLLQTVTVLLGALTLGARLGEWTWVGDVLALVLDGYLALAVGLAGAWALWRAWRWAAAAVVIAALAWAQLWAVAPTARTAPAGAAPSLRLVMFNLYYLNPDLEAAVAEVLRHEADVIFLMEYSEAIQARIEPAFADYPYRVIQPSRFTMGVAVFSRLPLVAATVHRGEATRIPVVEARVLVDGRPITLVGGHPWPPQPNWGALHRSQMLAIIEVAERAAKPLIVMGDFNAAPWAYTHRLLSARAGVRDVRAPGDWRKTFWPVPFFGLPLDHLLLSPEWEVVSVAYGPASGSDHLPLIAEVRLP